MKKKSDQFTKEELKVVGACMQVLNYSSSNALVMDIPISFNADLLFQLISPAWFLLPELNLSRATYNLWRLTRGSKVVTGRVTRDVKMSLHTKNKYRHRMRGKKKAPMKFFRSAPRPGSYFLSFFLSSRNERETASSTTHSFALLKGNELPVPMTFALVSPSPFVLNSTQSTHGTHN